MAGSNSIQILRSKNIKLTSNHTLLAGQPLYVTDKNYLVIGKDDGDPVNKYPVDARKLTWYMGDTDARLCAAGIVQQVGNITWDDTSTSKGIRIYTSAALNGTTISSGIYPMMVNFRVDGSKIEMAMNNSVSASNPIPTYLNMTRTDLNIMMGEGNISLNAAGRLSLNGTYANIEASDAIFVQSFSPTTGMSNITLNGPSINIAGTSIRLNGANGNYISIGGAISMSSYSTGIAGYQFNVNTSLTNISSSNVYISGSSRVNINSPSINIGALTTAVNTNISGNNVNVYALKDIRFNVGGNLYRFQSNLNNSYIALANFVMTNSTTSVFSSINTNYPARANKTYVRRVRIISAGAVDINASGMDFLGSRTPEGMSYFDGILGYQYGSSGRGVRFLAYGIKIPSSGNASYVDTSTSHYNIDGGYARIDIKSNYSGLAANNYDYMAEIGPIIEDFYWQP